MADGADAVGDGELAQALQQLLQSGAFRFCCRSGDDRRRGAWEDEAVDVVGVCTRSGQLLRMPVKYADFSKSTPVQLAAVAPPA